MLSRYKYGSYVMSVCVRGREQHLSLRDSCHLCVREREREGEREHTVTERNHTESERESILSRYDRVLI